MKSKIVLTLVAIALSSIGNAQTNTFPASGNVGVGTTSPSALLHTAKDSYGEHLRLERIGAAPSNYTINLEGNRIYHKASVDQVFQSNGVDRLIVKYGGNIGIGTDSPTHSLSVNGTIRAKEVIVDTGWSDFVFDDSYRLRSLDEVESHIAEYGHLPDVPSAEIVESDGLSVGEAQKIMMQKIEELTLYAIEQDKKNTALQNEVRSLRELLVK